MTFIDSVLLNAAESFCRRFQVLTGRTNVWLAVQLTNLSVVVYFVWAALAFWNTDIVARMSVGLFCGALLYLLTQTLFKVPIETYESHAYSRAAKGLRNPRRIRDAILRTSFLTLCLMLPYPVYFAYVTLGVRLALLTYSLVVLTTMVLYLLACDPLPPCAARLKEWLRPSAPVPVPGRQPADQRHRRAS